MKKRLTSLLLALVMVLLCVPTWGMPAAAEMADAEKTVYVRFRLADAREYGYTGTVVSETAQAPGFASIVYPTDLQLLSYGIKPSDVLGWYHIQPDGTFVDASAYNGVYISEDLNFYPYLKSSSMSFNSPANVPVLGEAGSNKILALRGGGATYGELTEKFLVEQVKAAVAADPTAPILIYNHIGYGAIEGSSKMTLSAETAALINQYPQIVWFTGHTHYASQDPLMIQQESFTNIQLPTSGSKWWWYYAASPTTASYPSAYATEANQGLILTISDTDVIYAERYDFGTKETIGQKWRIDIPAILRSKENFTYRVDERIAQAKAPEFAADAKMTVETTATSASFQVPLATVNDAVSDNMVEFYTIIVTDPNGDIVYTEKKLSEYYRASRQTPYITFEASGLKPETDYQVYVRADSIFGKSSDALQTTITTKESRDPREYLTEILNIDYGNGVTTDKKGHATKTIGTPALANGMATFAGSSAYQYALTSADKTAMASTLTIEAVLTINDYIRQNSSIGSYGNYDALISNVQSGGFGLNYVHNEGKASKLDWLTYSGTASYDQVQAMYQAAKTAHMGG